MQSDYLLVMYAGGLCTCITVDVRLPLYLHHTRQKSSKCKRQSCCEETCFKKEKSWVFCCTFCENYFSQNIRFNSNSLSLHTVESNETLHDVVHVQSFNNGQLKEDAGDGSHA